MSLGAHMYRHKQAPIPWLNDLQIRKTNTVEPQLSESPLSKPSVIRMLF